MIARDQFLRHALGDFRIGTRVIAPDDIQLHAGRQIFLVLLHVQADAAIQLLADGGERTGIGVDDAQFHLLGEGAGV